VPVPTDIGDLDTAAANNSPSGSDQRSQADNYLRAHAAFIAQLNGGKETICVDDYGALGDGSTNDQPAIAAAQAALVALGGGTLFYTFGKSYKVTSPIPHANGVTHEGTGLASIDCNGVTEGARIFSSSSDVFENVGAINAGITVKNLWLESTSGGGHIFDWTGAVIVAKVRISGCVLIQHNAAKSVINGQADHVFSIYFHDNDYQYDSSNSVPAIYLKADTINSIHMHDFWSHASADETDGTYSIWIESTNAAGPCFNVNIKQVVFEIPGGGAINLLSCRNSTIEDVGVYDLTATPNNPVFNIAKASGGPTTSGCSFRRIKSSVGTSGVPDMMLDLSVAGNSGFVIENCTLNYLDQVSTSSPGALHIANGISNFLNCAYTEFGSAATLDLRFVNQHASGKDYSIWNGYPGADNGYLNIYQDGAYVGAVAPTGMFQWGGSIGSPAFYVTSAGVVNMDGPVFPGDMSGAAQGVCAIRAGSGAPNNAVGQNGDFYFRSDTPGTLNQRLYVRAAGAYVALL
jgi:hypothetical protein